MQEILRTKRSTHRKIIFVHKALHRWGLTKINGLSIKSWSSYASIHQNKKIAHGPPTYIWSNPICIGTLIEIWTTIFGTYPQGPGTRPQGPSLSRVALPTDNEIQLYQVAVCHKYDLLPTVYGAMGALKSSSKFPVVKKNRTLSTMVRLTTTK